MPRSRAWLVAALLGLIVGSFCAVRLMRTPPEPAPTPPPPPEPARVDRDETPLPAPPPVDAGLLVEAAVDEARGWASRRPMDVHRCLETYAAAEDYVRAAIERMKAAGDKAKEAAFSAAYKDLLAESDAYTEKVATPAYLESLPWRDLLVDPMDWSATRNPPGFSFALEGGVLSITGPSAETKRDGIAAVLDAPGEGVRAFLLEMDFQIDGGAEMYFHVEPRSEAPKRDADESLSLETDMGLTKGRPYTLTVRALKQRCDWDVKDWDITHCEFLDPPLLRRRSGGIAFRVTPGTQLKITRMRIKALR